MMRYPPFINQTDIDVVVCGVLYNRKLWFFCYVVVLKSVIFVSVQHVGN